MTSIELNGLVLRETAVGENDSYLDLLTDTAGRMSVYARGVRSYKSKNREATLPLAFSAFTLQKKSDDFIVMSEAQKQRTFGSTGDLAVNALSMYVIETVREFALPDEPQPDLLRLALNTLYAIDGRLYGLRLIKAAYELRLMSDEGYAPDLSGCGVCGKEPDDGMCLDIMNGALICSSCLEKREESDGRATVLAPVSKAATEAMRYIVRAPLNRLFAFKTEPSVEAELSAACEQYLLNHLERSFTTLDFFKQVEKM